MFHRHMTLFLALLKCSTNCQKLDVISIDHFLSDPFHKSLYVPLSHLGKDNIQNIAKVFRDTQKEGRHDLLKSKMEMVYGINAEHEPMRTRKREPYKEDIEMMRTRKRKPKEDDIEMMRTRKRKPNEDDIDMMRTRKRKPNEDDIEMMRTRKRKPNEDDIEMMRTRKREPNEDDIEMMRTRKRKPNEDDIEMMRTRKRKPNEDDIDMMRTRKRKPNEDDIEMMRTRKREPNEGDIEMMRTRKRKPNEDDIEMMRTRKREPNEDDIEMMRTRKIEPNEDDIEMMRTRKREPFEHNDVFNFESCHSDQLVKYAVNSGNGTYNMKKNDLYFATIGQTHGHRHRRADKFDEGKFDIVSEEIVRRRDHEHQGPSLQPIKRFDFNDTIIQRFFDYDETTLSNIVVEILDQRCQANYDSAFIEVFKMINKDDYEKKPLNERVFLFRKFLRLYKEYNDEMLRGVMFDLPKRLKNYAIEHFLKNNPKNRDFLSYWQTDEEIDIRFRNLYQQLQHALIERNYEMEQQLYEMACPKGYTERLLDDYMNTNSAEALSLEKEEERLRAHAKKYLRRKLNSAALLSTTTANPNIEMDVITDPDMNVEHVETC